MAAACGLCRCSVSLAVAIALVALALQFSASGAFVCSPKRPPAAARHRSFGPGNEDDVGAEAIANNCERSGVNRARVVCNNSSCIKALSLSGEDDDRPPETWKRREVLFASLGAFLGLAPLSASAANLPSSTGADLSKTGTVDTLVPIVAMQSSILGVRSLLQSEEEVTPETCSLLLQSLSMGEAVPRDETAFKRIFDAYSTPVSYKQRFLDQNAFLVYYTKGYDGPGRPNIEEDDGGDSGLQTMQYGARNDAWAAMDELFVELEFGKRVKGEYDGSKGELVQLFDKVSVALDAYLSLAPASDFEEATRRLQR